MAEQSEKSFPFDSNVENGEYDRVYVAEDFARYFRAFISSGIFTKTSSNLQVIANNDMTITLKPGDIIIDGYRYENEADIVIPIEPADGVMNRIDRISVTWSKADRDIHYCVLKGESSHSPKAQKIRRNADYRDYAVADIYVKAGAISIAQENVTDTRLNTELCGIAIPFTELDTTALYDQIQSDLAHFKNVSETEFANWVSTQKELFNSWSEFQQNEYIEWITSSEQSYTDWINQHETEFVNWVQTLEGILDENAAGHLQNEIDTLNAKLDDETAKIRGITLEGTLVAWGKTLTFTDERIREGCTVNFYIDKYGIAAKDVSVEDGAIIMTFRQYDFDIKVKAVLTYDDMV